MILPASSPATISCTSWGGGEHFLSYGDFSNSLFLPRPPLFPLMIAALGGDTLSVLVMNCVLGAALVPVTIWLAGRFGLDQGASLVVGLVIALEPSMIVYSAFLGSEALANLLLAGMWLALMKMLRAESPRWRILWGGIAGFLQVGTSLARPASYLLWVMLGLWLLWQNRSHRMAVGVFMLVSALGIGGWITHNGQVFGHYTFSTVGNYALLYYHAASVERLASGDEMDAVYTRINERVETLLGHDPSDVDPGYMHRYLAATPEINTALRQVALEIMLAHPLLTAVTFPVGFVRMFGLLPGRVALFPSQVLMGLIEVVWNGLLLVGAGYGLWIVFRRREWMIFWLTLLSLGYFTGGVLLVKSVGNVRERSAILPLLVILAVMAVRHILRLRREHQMMLRPASSKS